ncbi:MAG: DUF86 domain-containing protein [Planctomycetes bacterium]|nr:DUF86 domain-containing protein [Planctomycetota bacterium]
MNDAHLIQKRLAFITDCVAETRQLGRPERLDSDTVQQRFVEHTLQFAIQAMLDVAFAIAAAGNLGEPGDNRQAFDGIAAAGWITPARRDTCRRMLAFRNIVHRDLQVDVAILQRIVTPDLDDLLVFVRAIRARLPEDQARPDGNGSRPGN